MDKKIRILSIDGGGIRGVIPAVILNYIEKGLQRQSGNPNVTLADYFDLVAGTSTGGILACYYLLPPQPGQECHSRYFAHEAIEMYARHGKDIFNRKWLRKGIAREKYSAAGLEKVLKDCMGETTLAESRKNCLVTAYDVTERKAVLFTSPEARKYEHRNYLMRDVARATSAAPVYFELAAIRSLGGAAMYLIDGAVYAGNPTMCAIVEANKGRGEGSFPPWGGLRGAYIVSVGTGKEKKKYDHNKAKNWGAIGWARPVIDVLLSASAEVVDYQMRQLFKTAECSDCYVRLEPELGKASPDMDDASDENIRRLIEAGEYFVSENVEALDEIVEKLEFS
ncbi:MAG: patatin-like phospholipase family protein [Leptospirales bacterium]|nr:patatin-like phospholipase family protein [Leptospirales bacterium]